VTLLAFAFGAGILATVNPCGFAVLPAFLAYYLSDAGEGEAGLADRLRQGLGVGVAVSTGFTAVFVGAGLLVTVGLRRLLPYVPWLAVAIGASLAVVGLAMLSGRHVGLPAGDRLRPGQARSYRRVVVFGAAYAVASLSCTLAVVLALVAQALAAANPLQFVGVFLAYGTGAAAMLVTLAVSAALAKASLTRALRRIVRFADRIAGAVLTASGAYLIAYWLPALRGGRSGRFAGSRVVSDASARLTELLDANQGVVAGLSAAVALTVGATVLVGRRRRRDVATADPCCEPDGGAARPYAATTSSSEVGTEGTR
jgi:cytochrome c-type biogenesis protein